jgi:hypothetical protein
LKSVDHSVLVGAGAMAQLTAEKRALAVVRASWACTAEAWGVFGEALRVETVVYFRFTSLGKKVVGVCTAIAGQGLQRCTPASLQARGRTGARLALRCGCCVACLARGAPRSRPSSLHDHFYTSCLHSKNTCSACALLHFDFRTALLRRASAHC